MRPYDSDYDEFEEFDDFGYPDIRAIRHMVNKRQRDELRLRGRRRVGPFERSSWQGEDWSEFGNYDDDSYDDYDADEFDSYSELSIENH